MKNKIIEKSSEEVYNYFSKHVNVESEKTFVVSTTDVFNITSTPTNYNVLINLSRINNVRFINKFFENVNAKLNIGDIYIICLETFSARRHRKPINKVPIINVFYFVIEFTFLRIFPKLKGFKTIYFSVTQGRNRLLSKAEAFGRLVSCGFEIEDYSTINGRMYVVAKKIKEPVFDMNPSYGPLYKMPRVGKNGEIIGVYKLRTMHPYAEYLQDYILKNEEECVGDPKV